MFVLSVIEDGLLITLKVRNSLQEIAEELRETLVEVLQLDPNESIYTEDGYAAVFEIDQNNHEKNIFTWGFDGEETIDEAISRMMM